MIMCKVQKKFKNALHLFLQHEADQSPPATT